MKTHGLLDWASLIDQLLLHQQSTYNYRIRPHRRRSVLYFYNLLLKKCQKLNSHPLLLKYLLQRDDAKNSKCRDRLTIHHRRLL